MSVSSEKLRKLRQYNGWSQDRLAEISGLSLRTIQRIENNGNASLESKLAIATALNISPSELLDDDQIVVGSGGLNWGGIIGISLCISLMFYQFLLTGVSYFELNSVLLVLILTVAMSAISLGLKNSATTLLLIRWTIFFPKNELALQKHLPYLNKIILYCHVAGAISTLVGIIAVFMTPASFNYQYLPAAKFPFTMGIGVAFLTYLYSCMLAELILRPLKHQIERLLIQHTANQHESIPKFPQDT